jgi:hypothetical protein
MHDHRLLDSLTWFSSGLAAVSFWHGISIGVTIVAGLIAIALGLIRLHDRLRFGPPGMLDD